MMLPISASQAADIVIGFTGPLSGPAAEYGQDCVTGLDMAIKDLNAAGGITVDGQRLLFRLEKMDDKVDPNRAIGNARQLLDKNALAIFNPVFSTSAALMKINEEECGEFILMSYTSNPKASQTGNQLSVIMAAPMTIYAQLLADKAWERGWRKAAMVVLLGTTGEQWRTVFNAYWKKLGGTITADKPANYFTRTDFAAPLAAALATKPDVMLIGGPSATTALVIGQSRAMGYTGGFILIDTAKMDYIAQLLDGTRLMDNVIGVAGFTTSFNYDTPAIRAFDKKYKANYKRPATWEVAAHYDSMMYLARAIQTANTIDDVYAIRYAFPTAMLGNKFAIETYGISPAGIIYVPAAVQTIKDGRYTPVEFYIWWTKTQAEFDKIRKTNKYAVPLKLFKTKIGTIE